MLKERLMGAWELVSFVARDSNGTTSYPLGEDAVGLIIYHQSGYFSVQLMPQNRPNFAINDQLRGEPEEVQKAFTSYSAYFGRYAVNEEEEFVNHLPIGSMFPNYQGRVLQRKIDFRDEQLILNAPSLNVNGVEISAIVTWKRAE